MHGSSEVRGESTAISFSLRLRLVCRPKYPANVVDNSPNATELRVRYFKSLLRQSQSVNFGTSRIA